MFYNQQGVG